MGCERLGHRGFTLLEVVLVILIVAVLAIVMVPRIDLEGDRTASVARKIVSDIRYAQRLANITRITHGVVFTAGSYTVFQNDDPTDPSREPVTGRGFVVDMTGDFNGVTLTPALGGGGNDDVVKFDSIGVPYRRDGTPVDAVSGNSIVISGGNVTRTVLVEPATGKVNVN